MADNTHKSMSFTEHEQGDAIQTKVIFGDFNDIVQLLIGYKQRFKLAPRFLINLICSLRRF